MSSKPRNSLRKALSLRLAALYTLSFVVSVAVLLVLVYFFLNVALARSDRKLIGEFLGNYSDQYQLANGHFSRDHDSDANLRRAAPLYVRILSPDLQTLYTAPNNALAFLLWKNPALLPANGDNYRNIALPDGLDIHLGDQRLPDGNWLQIAKSGDDRAGLRELFLHESLTVAIPMLILCAIIGAFLASRILKPLRAIQEAVESIISTGKVNARISPTKSVSDLSDLTRLFNQMLERIERLIQGMRDTLDNVAHDLRTPLARLRSIAELALRTPDDKEIAHEALADCIEESERVTTMLDTLMDISEVEAGAMQLRLKKLAVSDIFKHIDDLYQYVAEDKEITFTVEQTPGLHVVADETRISQAIANLVDNAIKYTPNKGRVTLTATADKHEITFAVSDDGPGIPAEDLPRTWDRLFRGDKSRNQQRGLGLGLSLVKAIAQAHKGHVSAESILGKGSTFRLHIPVTEIAEPSASKISLPHHAAI